MKKSLFLSCLLGLMATTPAMSHPHVWVTMQSSVVTDTAGLVTGVSVAWSFDEAYAQMALEGMDTNGDGQYSTEELQALTTENISSLRDYDYFIHIKLDGKLQPVPDVKDAKQTYVDNQLTLFFTVPLAKPIDPRSEAFELKIFDPEFYIAFDYLEQDPVKLAGKLPQGCNVAIKPIPSTQEIEQTRTLLASKDKDWKPETNEEFGSVFAQPVFVDCAT